MAAKNLNSRKRKGICQDILFEIDEDDISPTNSPLNEGMVNLELPPKIQKTNLEDNLKTKALNTDDLSEILTNKSDDKSSNCENIVEVTKETFGATVSSNIIRKEKSETTTTIDNGKDEGKNLQVPCNLNDTQSFEQLLNEKEWVVQDETFCESSILESDEKTVSQTIKKKYTSHIDGSSTAVTELLQERILELTNKNADLEKEILSLKEKLKDDNRYQTDNTDDNAVMKVYFLDNNRLQYYKNEILNYFDTSHVFIATTTSDSKVISVYEKNSVDGAVANRNESANDVETSPHKNKKKKKKKKSEEVDSLIFVDTSPALTTQSKVDVKYSSRFELKVSDGENIEESNKSKPQQHSCFNCDESHNLRDCPYPRDFRKINDARQKMKDKYQKSVRYHLEEDQKYDQFKPGRISDDLREALGIHKNELPPYIYRMRVLGYPPGWIMDAQDAGSSLSLFDIEGKDLNRENNSKKMMIDINKVIEYPGFNVPMEKGVEDEHYHHNCPPFSDNYSKEKMIDYLKQAYIKQKDNLETCDMDVDTSFALSVEDTSQEFDISLDDLEKKKTELLAQLDESSETSFRIVSEDTSLSAPGNENGDNSGDVSHERSTESSESNKKKVKASLYGTPILKSSSKFSKLPNPDNFAQNVSPILNFENLPNSTGKYEQMSSVLQKVRQTIKSLNQEKS